MAKRPELVALQKSLGEVADAIYRKVSETSDPDIARALVRELLEVNHRIAINGGLIFHLGTQDLSAAAAGIEAGKAKLLKKIETFRNVDDFIKSISRFLGLVDKLIDLAKQVVP